MSDLRDRFVACLLGGAVGDALGAPVEFLSRDEILEEFGPDGITDYAPAYGGLGRITDDTQMTLFTAEGLIRAHVRGLNKGITTYPGVTAHAYERWLRTQGEPAPASSRFADRETGWLFEQKELHARRAPGNTCLSALRAMESYGEPARNDSKGCGGVMRVAPVGLFGAGEHAWNPHIAFETANKICALTHGHPTGSLTGGALAVIIQYMAAGDPLPPAVNLAKRVLREQDRHEETLDAIEAAEALAADAEIPPERAIEKLGAGWIAEEALAISIYCSLVARDFRHGVLLAVNHGGDSDSTGAITGNILGVQLGLEAIPKEWLEPLELREVIRQLAEDLHDCRSWTTNETTFERDASGTLVIREVPSPDSAEIRARYPGF